MLTWVHLFSVALQSAHVVQLGIGNAAQVIQAVVQSV